MKYLTYLYTFLWDIPLWIVLLLMCLFWGNKLHWNNGLWFEFKPSSWPARSWYKKWSGTTLGHGGFYGARVYKGFGTDNSTVYHEQIHVEQYEANMLRMFLIGVPIGILLSYYVDLKVGLLVAASIQFLGAPLTWLPNWLQAGIRGEKIYKGSTHEESAYAQTELWERKKN